MSANTNTNTNIVMTGKGKSGSWLIRGLQLGAAIGATIDPRCKNFKHYSLAIHIKRIEREFLNNIRRFRKPWVWDVVDAYPQPIGNGWNQTQAIEWLRTTIADYQPDAMVFPTTRMQQDSEFKGPSIVLPHHAWPKYNRQEIREKVQTLGYEGGEQYLGTWGPKLINVCAKRGWNFSINGNLAECDIGIALRDPLGYPARHWKSNVKITNFHALGVPIFCTQEDSYVEFGSGHEVFLNGDRSAPLSSVFDFMVPYEARKFNGEMGHQSTIYLSEVAEDYTKWLNQLKF